MRKLVEKDEEIGGDINMENLKKPSRTRAIILMLCVGLLTASIGYFVGTQAATPSSYNTVIEQFSMIDTASWVMKPIGSTYYAKNGSSGEITSNTNFTKLWEDCIAALPTSDCLLPDPEFHHVNAPYGKIYLCAGTYNISKPLIVPVGSKMVIEGEGTSQQMISNGGYQGTQIVNSGSTPAFNASNSNDNEYMTGSCLMIRDIEFVQLVDLASINTPALHLDGMAQGILEDVQVVKSYFSSHQIQGTGIRQVMDDDAGGYTIWKQVQVAGFETGIETRVDHWEVYQLGIGQCRMGMKWSVCMANTFHGLHLFQLQVLMHVQNGFGTYSMGYIEGLYLEQSGNTTDGIDEFYIDGTFEGYVRIKRVNCNTCLSTIWNCNHKDRIWFEDVMTTGGTPSFPAINSTGNLILQDWVNVTNDQMQLVEVTVTGGIVNVQVNGVNITGTTYASTIKSPITVTLRVGDRIAVDYGTTTIWVWRAISAERLHASDP